MRTIANPDRGCGNLKENGFYVRSDTGSGGILQAWTHVLGELFEGGFNYYITSPARSMQLIRLPETLSLGELYQDAMPDRVLPHLAKLPAFALLDHVGTEHYTPPQFGAETARYGVSRRVPEAIAAVIAKFTPLPILFTSALMPTFQIDELTQYAGETFGDPREWRELFTPTPHVDGFGLTIKGDNGEWHGGVKMLADMESRRTAENAAPASFLKFAPPDMRVSANEQLFGASWITSVVCVVDPNNPPGTMAEMVKRGIEPVAAAAPGELS